MCWIIMHSPIIMLMPRWQFCSSSCKTINYAFFNKPMRSFAYRVYQPLLFLSCFTLWMRYLSKNKHFTRQNINPKWKWYYYLNFISQTLNTFLQIEMFPVLQKNPAFPPFRTIVLDFSHSNSCRNVYITYITLIHSEFFFIRVHISLDRWDA